MTNVVVVTSDPSITVTQDSAAITAVVPVAAAPYSYLSLADRPALGTAAALDGSSNCGRVTYVSTTQIAFRPFNGNLVQINGVLYPIPSGGVTISNAGLTTSTLYYVYVYMNAGVMTLEFSTTGHMTSVTAGNVGIEIKTGDDTRSLVGMVKTDASGIFLSNGRQLYVASWFNRRLQTMLNTTGSDLSTTSQTAIDVAGAGVRPEILAWNGEIVVCGVVGYVTTNGGVYAAALSVNGTRIIIADPTASGINGGGRYDLAAPSDSIVYEGYFLNNGNGTDTISLKSGAVLSVSSIV